MLNDFHIHSNFSDGKHSIPEIVDFYGSRGFGSIAITDHLCESSTFLGKAAAYLDRTLTSATFPLYLEILKSEKERAWDQYKMVLIPGFEITKNSLFNHRSAHIIALGITDWVAADGEIETILKNIRNQGALTIAAHPVSNGELEKQTLHLWDQRRALAHLFDAWEVASGPKLFDAVLESGLPMIASSDLHRFSQMSSWKTVMHCERKTEAILDSIRRQNLKFEFYQENHDRSSFPTPAILDNRSYSHRHGNLDLVQALEW